MNTQAKCGGCKTESGGVGPSVCMYDWPAGEMNSLHDQGETGKSSSQGFKGNA